MTAVTMDRTADRPSRYPAALAVIHWATALLMFIVVPLAWVAETMTPGTPTRVLILTTHKSIGLTILALSVIRLFVRSPAPDHAAGMGRLQTLVARTCHALLYVILLTMPISGYLFSIASNHPFAFFGLFPVPELVPIDPRLAGIGKALHAVGQWAVYGLVGLHVLGAFHHVVIQRDGLLRRMWIG